MKKILVALVVLALAGGGAFAQGWTFNGLVDGGMGIFINEQGDDAFMQHIGSPAGGRGIRTQLDTRFVNADGNAGLWLRIRQDHRDDDIHFNVAQGWVSLMDNMLTVYGGLIDHGYFNMLDRMTGEDMGEGLGLSFIVRPMDNLTLGFGAFGANNVRNYLAEAPQGKFTFGVAFDEPDLFQVRFGVRNTNEANATGFTNWGVAPYDAAGRGPRDTQGSLAYLSFAYLALEDIHLAATAAFQNLEEFGDHGAIRFYVTAGHTGLVENMDLRLGVALGLPMWDETPVRGDDMHLWIWASAAYELSDMVVPRLDLHYVMGGTAGNFDALHHNQFRNSANWNSDFSFVQIRPSVQLRATPNAFLEAGGIFNIDLGDYATWLGANGTNIGVYALVRVNF